MTEHPHLHLVPKPAPIPGAYDKFEFLYNGEDIFIRHNGGEWQIASLADETKSILFKWVTQVHLAKESENITASTPRGLT